MKINAHKIEIMLAEQGITKEEMSAFCGSEQFLGRFLTVLHFKKLGKEVFRKIVWQTEAILINC